MKIYLLILFFAFICTVLFGYWLKFLNLGHNTVQ
jgi:hypothetical protein